MRALKATADTYNAATEIDVVVTERKDFALPEPG